MNLPSRLWIIGHLDREGGNMYTVCIHVAQAAVLSKIELSAVYQKGAEILRVLRKHGFFKEWRLNS